MKIFSRTKSHFHLIIELAYHLYVVDVRLFEQMQRFDDILVEWKHQALQRLMPRIDADIRRHLDENRVQIRLRRLGVTLAHLSLLNFEHFFLAHRSRRWCRLTSQMLIEGLNGHFILGVDNEIRLHAATGRRLPVMSLGSLE